MSNLDTYRTLPKYQRYQIMRIFGKFQGQIWLIAKLTDNTVDLVIKDLDGAFHRFNVQD